MAVSDVEFKRALSHFASGITVITTENGGTRYGMTVASFASLSLDPPLVLICIEKGVQTHDAIVAAGKFGVSILDAAQGEISNIFATRVGDRFADLSIRQGSLGLPLIEGALTTLECSLHQQLPGGDHTIFVGQVEAVTTREGSPLIYYRSGYHRVAEPG